jgi:signal transduction histidine kinase
LFQAVRELLFNVVKHADVAEVSLRLQPDETGFRIDIVDHGLGFEVTQGLDSVKSSTGQGLIATRDRLQLIGVRLDIQSTPGEGTQIRLVVPIDNQGPGPEAG